MILANNQGSYAPWTRGIFIDDHSIPHPSNYSFPLYRGYQGETIEELGLPISQGEEVIPLGTELDRLAFSAKLS